MHKKIYLGGMAFAVPPKYIIEPKVYEIERGTLIECYQRSFFVCIERLLTTTVLLTIMGSTKDSKFHFEVTLVARKVFSLEELRKDAGKEVINTRILEEGVFYATQS